ncbi:hypothetical protein [Romboutsia hominis]|uniref:Uncharacterized protein n=1 Tax=Romboutsia hominis TaxID=1507512 RepID=A0A2P2BPW6_9FIRM|nr:hypothetical protein [Romboutsia hominis]MCH1959688.1 hypothetical protein [Romboutsia hominis]MCH1969889.1 hypothetical protein [Romboutsia hominis]CEI72367.1 Hypothetical protein FRIFI_0824 [Romboutsia hominis]
MFGKNNCFCDDNFLIIFLLLLCNNGFDCDFDFDCDNNKCFIFIIIIILLFCCNKKRHDDC